MGTLININRLEGSHEQGASEEMIGKELSRLFPARHIRKVLFIAPPDADSSMFDYATARRGRYWNYPPYGVGIIASHLRNDGLGVRILNLNHEILKACRSSASKDAFDFDRVWKDKLQQEVASFQPDIIGITCMFTMTHRSAVLLCNEIKQIAPNIPVALGGVHITNCFISASTSESLLEDFCSVDLFFLYEADLSFKDFIKIVNQGAPLPELSQVCFNTAPHNIYISSKKIPNEKDMDIVPAHDLMTPTELSSYGVIGSFFCLKEKGTRFTTILSNRGCRGQCTFCSVRNFNGITIRHRSVQSLVDELILLREKFGIGHVMWLDDDFFHDHKRAIALFNEMIRRNTDITWDCTNGVLAASCKEEVIAAAAESGCIGLNIGVESGNPEILKKTKKPGTIKSFLKAAEVLRKHEGINSRVFLMIGFPEETYRMILDTFTLSMEMDLDWYNITLFQPLPNTPLFDEMVEKGGLDKVKFDSIRYSSGPYGKVRQNANKNGPTSDFKGTFRSMDLDRVPKQAELYDIWFSMNYYLNFDRLRNEERPAKLDQQLRYVRNITDLVAPDDPFAMYFCGYLQNKVLGAIDHQLIRRLEERLHSSEYWRQRFHDFSLSAGHLKTGIFPCRDEKMELILQT